MAIPLSSAATRAGRFWQALQVLLFTKQTTRFIGTLLLLLCASLAWAEPAATVVSLVGTVAAQSPGGKVRILCQDATLSAQDTVTTQRDSYVRLLFSDGGQITLRPQTALRLDSYHYDTVKPAQDNLVFNLLKGGMRAVSGLIGHRGNPDAYKAQAGVATIGIRGTRYGLLLCNDNCQSLLAESLTPDDADKTKEKDKKHITSTLGNGLYLDVTAGEIVVSNDAGSRDYTVGQYGRVDSGNTLPALLAQDPGLNQLLPAAMDNSPDLGNLPGIHQGAACVIR
jgi:hypothetical protein